MKKSRGKGCLIAIAVIVVLALIGSFAGGGEKSLKSSLKDAHNVSYRTLHKDYMNNAIGADEKYKGKMLILSGKIDDINREIAGEPYVTFAVDDFMQNVRITFYKDEESKVAKLSKGQMITVVGECRGLLLDSVVMMDDCFLVTNKNQ